MSVTITGRLLKAYDGFRRIASLGQSPLLLAVRLYWGWQFIETGWGKLEHLDRVAAFFASLGIPAPHLMAPLIGCVEFFGGAFLVLGLASRLTGLVLTGNMVVAFLTADRMAFFSVLSDPGKFYGATPYTFLFASLLILLFGPGLFAMDTWLRRLCSPRQAAQG